MRRQRSASTPHDAVAIDRGPQRRPSFLLALGRQRPHLCRSARSARNRTANLLAQPAIRLFAPARTPTLQGKAIGSAASLQRPRHPRRGQIPIAPAAPSVPNTPRFRALALFGRRPPERVDDLCIPASENLHTSGSRRAFSTARTSKDPMTRMHDGSGGHHPGTARASHEPRQIASHSGLERNLPRRLPLAFVSLTVGEWVIPALQVSQKRKRSPTVGSMVLRLMKPFARPPLTCENMIPAYASNFFANCQSATKETASNVPWQFANAEGLLQLTNARNVGCV